MDQLQHTPRTIQFFRSNWLKILFAALLLYVIFKRDLSFQVNLSSPLEMDEIAKPPVSNPEMPSKKEKYSEAAPATYQSKRPASKDLFEFFSRPREESSALVDHLKKVDEAAQIEFLKRFARVAISERHKFEVPSSIILATALLHSTAGQITYASSLNNFFGLQCTADWEGRGQEMNGQPYRAYDNAWASFRDFSLFISSAELGLSGRIPETDFQAWAEALEKQRISDVPDLADHLIRLIRQFRLAELDTK
ncbi:MAG: glucosaminidase domain-containing protein [Phaeodactylibacter sp.]|nr:glucosaminidase domain-containing protein [Phaeodactylibacter sp.]